MGDLDDLAAAARDAAARRTTSQQKPRASRQFSTQPQPSQELAPLAYHTPPSPERSPRHPFVTAFYWGAGILAALIAIYLLLILTCLGGLASLRPR